jgi:hypothetical protein
MNYSVERIHSSAAAAAAQKCRAHWSGNEKLSFSMNPSRGGLSYGKFRAIDEKFEVGLNLWGRWASFDGGGSQLQLELIWEILKIKLWMANCWMWQAKFI